METTKFYLIIANQLNHSDITKLRNFQLINPQAKFFITYIVPPIPASFYRIPSMYDVNKQLYRECQHKLSLISHKIQVAPAQCFLTRGGAATALQLAKQLRIQTIITKFSLRFRILSVLGFGTDVTIIKPFQLYQSQARHEFSMLNNLTMQGG